MQGLGRGQVGVRGLGMCCPGKGWELKTPLRFHYQGKVEVEVLGSGKGHARVQGSVKRQVHGLGRCFRKKVGGLGVEGWVVATQQQLGMAMKVPQQGPWQGLVRRQEALVRGLGVQDLPATCCTVVRSSA